MDKSELLKVSLDEKIKQSKILILDWYLQFKGQVCISYSGGKDSTVLLHLARSMKTCKDIKGVFVDTGLEYPEIRDFVKKQENIDWVKPKLTFKQVLEKHGWPIISKEQSKYIYELRTTKSDKLRDIRLNGRIYKNNRSPFGILSKIWRPLLDCDIKISDQCCRVMKKMPIKTYQKANGLKPIIGVLAEESRLRMQIFMKGNCNQYSAKDPISRPLLFWTEQDILEYLHRNNIEIAKCYGEIIRGDDGNLKTTGTERTGCMFCMYGLHLEKHPNRFDKMKETHPAQYKYIMEKLGGKKVVCEYLACAHGNQFDLFTGAE